VRATFSRITELNSQLARYPRAAGALIPEPLANDILEDIKVYAMPPKWQQQLTLNGYDPDVHNETELLTRLEALESVETDQGVESVKQATQPNAPNRKRQHGNNKDAKKQKFYCKLHGRDQGHNTERCLTLKHQAKKAKMAYEEDKKPKARGSKDSKELYAVIEDAVNRALKKSVAGKKRKSEHFNLESGEETSIGKVSTDEINKFLDELSVDDDRAKPGHDDDENIYDSE
jgi:hypothetical protein